MNNNEAICPVMKNPVDPEKAAEQGLTVEYQGKVFYFCCPGCQPKFAEDPEKYVAGLPQENPSSDKSGCGGCC